MLPQSRRHRKKRVEFRRIQSSCGNRVRCEGWYFYRRPNLGFKHCSRPASSKVAWIAPTETFHDSRMEVVTSTLVDRPSSVCKETCYIRAGQPTLPGKPRLARPDLTTLASGLREPRVFVRYLGATFGHFRNCFLRSTTVR